MAEEAKTTRAKSDTVAVTVLRDFWPTDNDGDRVRKGAVIEVSKDEALDGIEAGHMARVKK